MRWNYLSIPNYISQTSVEVWVWICIVISHLPGVCLSFHFRISINPCLSTGPKALSLEEQSVSLRVMLIVEQKWRALSVFILPPGTIHTSVTANQCMNAHYPSYGNYYCYIKNFCLCQFSNNLMVNVGLVYESLLMLWMNVEIIYFHIIQ